MTNVKYRRRQLFIAQGGECFWCHKQCTIDTPSNGEKHLATMFTIDHIVPQYRGGGDHDENIVGACSYCNLLRSRIEQSIVLGKPVGGFLPKNQILLYLPIMSVEEVLIEMKPRLWPKDGKW